MEKMAIVMPAHNEQYRIGPTVKAYLDFFGKIKAVKTEIIIVLNACTDRTREVVEQYSCKQLKILEFKRGGKGFAVIEGFKYALSKDFGTIGFVDADMATTPAAYYHLYKKLPGKDGVIASRYIPGAVVKPKPSIQRIIFSRAFNIAIRSVLFLSYKDTQCGAKIFTKRAVAFMIPQITFSQFAFDVDILYALKKGGFSISEIPTIWMDREYSKVNAVRAGPTMVLAIIRLRILHSPLRRFIRIYDFWAGITRKALKK